MRRYLLMSFFLLLTTSASSQGIYSPSDAKGIIHIPGFRTYTTEGYKTSDENVVLLAKLKPTLPMVRLSSFSATNPGQSSLLCRLSYPVYLPEKVSFESYLAEAMRVELREAGFYSDNASIELAGHLIGIDFNSFGTGKWNIEMSFSVNGREPVTFKHEHTYPVSGAAAYACDEVTKALIPALQEFLKSVYSDTKFLAMLKGIDSPSPTIDASPTSHPLP